MNKSALSPRQLVFHAAVFAALVALTLYLLLRGQDLSELFSVLRGARAVFLLPAIGCMCIFLLCEACNLRRCLHLFGCSCTAPQAVSYALTGYFFSSITPSASGGQPMQLYAMYRDGIPPSCGTLALLTQFSCFQFVTVSFAAAGFCTQLMRLNREVGNFRYFFAAGAGVNVLLLAVTLTAVFSRRLSAALLGGLSRLLRALHIKKAEAISHSLQEQLALYQQSAVTLRRSKGTVCRMLAVTVVQIAAFYSVPCWISLSLGLPPRGFWAIFATQAIVHVTVSALPLPGAVGASEGAFLLLFRGLFPRGALHDAMLLSRGVGFYLFVVLSGCGVAFRVLFLRKKPGTPGRR